MRVSPRPFFGRPIQTDPLFWFGIVGGLVLSVVTQLRRDVPVEDFVWGVFSGTFCFTWWIAGLVLSTIRYQVRRRRAAKEPEETVAAD